MDEFEFWIPYRRPSGKNLAFEISPAIVSFDSINVCNGYVRPWISANSWTADLSDKTPTLSINWSEEKKISEINLFFDPDYDHAMESVQYGHPEDVVPFMVRNYTIKTIEGEVLANIEGNYQALNTIQLGKAIQTKGIVIELEHPSETTPATLFEVVVR